DRSGASPTRRHACRHRLAIDRCVAGAARRHDRRRLGARFASLDAGRHDHRRPDAALPRRSLRGARRPVGVARMIAYGVAGGRVVARVRGGGVVAVGDVIRDDMFEQSSLNAFMAEGPAAWRETRDAVLVARDVVSRHDTQPEQLGLPFAVADYVDFYSSIHHATNLGRLFRPDSEPLLPNWKHLPVGYHGRAGTVVVSGTDVVRPTGLVATEGGVTRQPSARLDIELEVGFVVGVGSAPNTAI